MNLMSYVQPRALARHRREREERNARIQRGECPGLSPVRTLADMSPEERARVIAEIQANHAQKQRPAAVAPPRPVARSAEPLPVTAEERAQEAEERAAAIQVSPEPEPIPADEAQEEPMLTTIESARNLREELENLAAMQAEKRRAALTLADELEQEARALRDAAGGVALTVRTDPPPKAMSKPLVPPKKSSTGRPAGSKNRAPRGTLRARILAAVDTTPTPRTLITERVHDIAKPVVAHALGELAKQGKIVKVQRAVYRRVA